MNLFEITHSLLRQFGPEQWTLYKGKHLLSFVDNHDVTRAASILNNKNHLIPLYGMLFGMPGVPCIYYGSEWGCEATKHPETTIRCVHALINRSGTNFATLFPGWQRHIRGK